ncbi:MAG: hypothetical protein Q9186_006257 [Xanthomendoza sp. 1 TL-2023]
MDSPRTWRPQPTIYRPGPYTVEASDAVKVDGESIPRRIIAAKDGFKTVPEDGVKTVYDILRHSASKYGHAQALGSRKLLRTHEDIKKVKKTVEGRETTVDKKWAYYELSDYRYMSFREYEQMALQCGAGLRKLGMNKDDRLHIFAATTPYWLAMAHGAATQSMPIVTAYDTLGEEGLQHSLCQTRAKAIFLEPSLLPKLLKPLKHAEDIHYVFYNSAAEVDPQDVERLREEHPDLVILSFEELRSLGESNPVDPIPPLPDDLCCIMYTSGSTGAPKGVLLKHKNVVAAIAGVHSIVGRYLGPGDRMIVYLPLAHIFEFMFENASLFWGCTMGYGNAKTLTETSVRNCKGDIRQLAPTVMVGVPAVWELVKKGIISKVESSNPIARNMFWGALSLKSALLSAGLPGVGILDSLVFSKIKEATGGQLRISMNGGGPVAKDTQRFLSMCLTPMINGYGLTETCASWLTHESRMGAICDPASWTDQAIGEVPGSIEIKLVDVPDLGYFSSSQPVSQGEIWIRGPAVTEGYLDLEEENKASFYEGWFKTGDIGEFDNNGHLRVIDRKKNMVKTLNGEYIALEKLESIYRSCSLVANICVYAAEHKIKPIGIVVPVEAVLKSIAKQNDISGETLEELASDNKLHQLALKEIQEVGKRGGLTGIEIIDGLAANELTLSKGLVTSAQKVNRKFILQKYKDDVDAVYKD